MNASMITHVGMDVHAQSVHYSIRYPGKDAIQAQSAHSAEAVRKIIRSVQRTAGGPVRACYEAGPTGFELQRALTKEGVYCAVIAPSLIPRKAGDRVKTDSRDASKLRELDEAGLLTEVHVPTREEEAARSLTRRLERARHEMTKAKLALSSMCLRLSIVRPTKEPWTAEHKRWLSGLRLDQASDQLVLEDCLLVLQHAEERWSRLGGHVEALARTEPFAAKIALLRCFKGIETATAMGIATELVAPERFVGARQVMAYCGLVVSEHSSGESRRQGGITKTGNAHLRRLLVRAAGHARNSVARESKALRARRKDQPAWIRDLARKAERRLHDKHYRLLHRGKSPNVAVTAVARELAGFAWAALTHDARHGNGVEPRVDADGVLLEA